jgi:hypothetical protein
MVVPSAIWVPHPLQKAIDFPRPSGLPQNKAKTVNLPVIPNGESYQNQGSKANRIAGLPDTKHQFALAAGRLDLRRNVCRKNGCETATGMTFNINTIRRLGRSRSLALCVTVLRIAKTFDLTAVMCCSGEGVNHEGHEGTRRRTLECRI